MKTRQSCMRLRALGLPTQQTAELITLFQRWTRCSGYEWTVSRFKDLKQELISRRAGGTFQAPYVSRNRHDGLPSGTLHYIFKKALSGSDKTFMNMVNVLMVYSTLTNKSMTPKQEKKFFGSMESNDMTGMDARLHYYRRFKQPRKNASEVDESDESAIYVARPKAFVEFCVSPLKSAPSLLGTSIRSDDAFGQFLFFVNSKPCLEALEKFPLVFQDVVPQNYVAAAKQAPDFGIMRSGWHPYGLPECKASVGKIGLIQEPGCKLRAVANPNAIWQAALQPLKALVLRDLQVKFPCDCTHDQEAGALVIQNWLQQGKTCFSVDLSDATNLMPLPLQIGLLKGRYEDAGKNDYLDQLIDAFEFASRAPWYLKTDTGYRLCRFTRGQPLGLQPSFAVFALTHNVLLEGLCERVGVNPVQTFRILGDDIVISDPEVHRLYRETLKNLGCKVSESKCLQSNVMAEFAGYIITKDFLGHAYKWKEPSWDNFISLCEEYGPKARQLMYGVKRKVVDALAPIPSEIGGFGWNPQGIPLAQRLDSDLARFLLSYVQGETLGRYRTLTSLITRFDKQVTEAGLLNTGFIRPLNVDPWAIGQGLPSREARKWGWSNESVISSLKERDSVDPSVPHPDDFIYQKPLPAGFHSCWIPGYGEVINYGTVSQDPRNSKKATLYSLLEQGLVQAQASEKEMRAFKRFIAGEKRQQPAKTFAELQKQKPVVPQETYGIKMH